VLALLGAIATLSGDVQGSLHTSLQALAVAVEAGDLDGQAIAHSNIGVCHHLLGDATGSHDEYDAALQHYREARALGHRLGRRLQSGMIASNMGQIHVRLGNDQMARRLIHEGLTAVRESGGTATLMFCVLAEADRRLVNGDTPSSLELIGLVRGHPAFTRDNEIESERILGRSGLPADTIGRGLAMGAGLDFDDAVDRIVQELADADSVS
jgi:hypothetical protein